MSDEPTASEPLSEEQAKELQRAVLANVKRQSKIPAAAVAALLMAPNSPEPSTDAETERRLQARLARLLARRDRKDTPRHQGAREKARRLRQLAKGQL